MQFSTFFATTLTLFTAGSFACVKITASVSSGLSTTVEVTINDNGVQTCKGLVKGCAGVIPCNTSQRWYWAYADTCHNSLNMGPTIQYQTDHGKWEWKGMSGNCDSWNCCGGNIPCVCRNCWYTRQEFC
ncbi:hypothetical protein L211DRAFT_841828 [Terfezia boudieri ATCC MYA-4762]|uniref:Uncharacterized protein n=1 Tax=Terfezia boudieri ATCC MYA-4762 TaxID=1051890 RepID=A0A3N4LFR2_9PEZI|nr:hypothetical protein L211DRAFT_841828 [Terfezia boudieri ATCC MYA-4762]